MLTGYRAPLIMAQGQTGAERMALVILRDKIQEITQAAGQQDLQMALPLQSEAVRKDITLTAELP